jgi:hypothetical protein
MLVCLYVGLFFHLGPYFQVFLPPKLLASCLLLPTSRTRLSFLSMRCKSRFLLLIFSTFVFDD